MSMLSVQVENLRIMARLVRDYDYREISRALRDAADTIDELRNVKADSVEATRAVDSELDDDAMLRLHDRMNVVLKRLGADDIYAVADAHEIIEDAARIGREAES